jgi:hypothetical protein
VLPHRRAGKALRVELLYFDGCPNFGRLLPRLQVLVDEHAPGNRVRLRRVESPAAAEKERFLGSPTVRVEGEDVEPSASARSDFGLKCRLYRSASPSDTPADEWIVAALRRAQVETG